MSWPASERVSSSLFVSVGFGFNFGLVSVGFSFSCKYFAFLLRVSWGNRIERKR